MYASRQIWNALRGGWVERDGRRAYIYCDVERAVCYCEDRECEARTRRIAAIIEGINAAERAAEGVVV